MQVGNRQAGEVAGMHKVNWQEQVEVGNGGNRSYTATGQGGVVGSVWCLMNTVSIITRAEMIPRETRLCIKASFNP